VLTREKRNGAPGVVGAIDRTPTKGKKNISMTDGGGLQPAFRGESLRSWEGVSILMKERTEHEERKGGKRSGGMQKKRETWGQRGFCTLLSESIRLGKAKPGKKKGPNSRKTKGKARLDRVGREKKASLHDVNSEGRHVGKGEKEQHLLKEGVSLSKEREKNT